MNGTVPSGTDRGGVREPTGDVIEALLADRELLLLLSRALRERAWGAVHVHHEAACSLRSRCDAPLDHTDRGGCQNAVYFIVKLRWPSPHLHRCYAAVGASWSTAGESLRDGVSHRGGAGRSLYPGRSADAVGSGTVSGIALRRRGGTHGALTIHGNNRSVPTLGKSISCMWFGVIGTWAHGVHQAANRARGVGEVAGRAGRAVATNRELVTAVGRSMPKMSVASAATARRLTWQHRAQPTARATGARWAGNRACGV